MKIFLRSSGGFANIQIQGEVDTTDLPAHLAKKAKTLLTPNRIKNVSGIENPQYADSQQIHVRVSSPEGSIQFELDESTADQELFALCNDLIHEIVRRKIKK